MDLLQIERLWKQSDLEDSGGWRRRYSVDAGRGGGSIRFAGRKLVYFRKRTWSSIWTVPVEGGIEKSVPESERFDRIFRSWGVVNQGIYFMSRQDGPRQAIHFFSFGTRQVTQLATFDKEPIWDYPNVALSSDGRRLLFACLDKEVNDLMLIENFR